MPVVPLNDSLDEGLRRLCSSPVSAEELAKLEAHTSLRLPTDYKQFSETLNGVQPVSGLFAVGLYEQRANEPYSENDDVLFTELYGCSPDDNADLLARQFDYGLRTWVPNHLLAIGGNPGVTQVLLDLQNGEVLEWTNPTGSPSDWRVFSESMGKSFTEFWNRLRIVGGQ